MEGIVSYVAWIFQKKSKTILLTEKIHVNKWNLHSNSKSAS